MSPSPRLLLTRTPIEFRRKGAYQAMPEKKSSFGTHDSEHRIAILGVPYDSATSNRPPRSTLRAGADPRCIAVEPEPS